MAHLFFSPSLAVLPFVSVAVSYGTFLTIIKRKDKGKKNNNTKKEKCRATYSKLGSFPQYEPNALFPLRRDWDYLVR